MGHGDHRFAACVLLTGLCGIQGLATLAIDLHRSHATNPHWPGHARFHVVWQSMNVALLSALEVGLIWWPGPYAAQRFYLAVVLASVSCFGFLLALLGRRLYGGTLSDPNGIPSARIAIAGRTLSIDLNLAAILAALFTLAAIVGIYS
ncbi:MAG TPA: hypothetical protein VH250_02080 [Granulicella sp.]|nr:hypothetical protein [Granulicella sp.]